MVISFVHRFAFGFALSAVFRIRLGFQTFPGNRFAAIQTDPVFRIFQPLKGFINHFEDIDAVREQSELEVPAVIVCAEIRHMGCHADPFPGGVFAAQSM